MHDPRSKLLQGTKTCLCTCDGGTETPHKDPTQPSPDRARYGTHLGDFPQDLAWNGDKRLPVSWSAEFSPSLHH